MIRNDTIYESAISSFVFSPLTKNMSRPTNEEFSHGKDVKFFRLVELLRLTFFLCQNYYILSLSRTNGVVVDSTYFIFVT